MSQLALDGITGVRNVRPAPERQSPTVWVRALRIMRALGDGPHQAVRQVRLRRGLNIIWAPPQGSVAGSPSGPPSAASIAGHTAGKTSFVRLLRYVLGERHFASESVRRRVRERLPEGWVLAEVEVAGETWAVARPLGVGAHPFCARGAVLDAITSAPREDFRRYLDALAAAVLPALPAARFPDDSGAIGWEHVLPWLTRDQECRFSDLVEWRHPSSASESPALTVDQRHFLIRAVLDLVTDAERVAQQHHAELLANRKRLVDRRPLLEHQGRTDTERLQRLLDVELPPSEGLFAEAGTALLERRRAIVAEQQAHLTAAAAAREEATRMRDAAVAVLARADHDVREAERRLGIEERTLMGLDAKQAGRKVDALLADLPPGSRYCNVPMTEADRQGCPLASSRTVALDERRAALTAEEERAAQAAMVAAHRSEVATRQDALRSAEEDQRSVHGRYVRAQTAYDEARDALQASQQALQETERLLTFATSSWREAERSEEDVLRLTSEIEKSLEYQKALREERKAALAELSATFEHVIQVLLGRGVQGRVESSGRALTLHVERDGDRDSAALATVKLLAFDLAALTASVEGRGAFPRFLVHDGPREADLAHDIYERLFKYAAELEKASPGEPAFQYVVTTTSEPPADMQSAPWLQLILSGASSDARLYGMDL
jgi:hypothetical protein